MPRSANRTIETKIAEIDAKIAKKREEIKALEAKRRELGDSHNNEMAIKIVKLAGEKGISLEELVASLEK